MELFHNPIFFSPLEQFTIIAYVPLYYNNLFFSFTSSSLFMCLSAGLFLYFLDCAFNKGGFAIPTGSQSIAEMMYSFISDLVKEQVGEPGKPYFPIIFTTFSFILTANLIGMIPYGFTTTSHFVVTFALSVSIFFGVTIVGFQKHGIDFLSFLLPPGAPLGLAPLLVLLELVSYCFRAISLGVRLFANMMAGHTLVVIIAGFGWSMICAGGSMLIVSLIPMLIVFALMGLEIGVSFLQAYVFTILSCIYLNDAIALH